MATTLAAIAQQESVANSKPDVATSAATFARAALEASLIDRVVDGDHEAFADLLKPYERMIYVTALSVLGNEADAEEAAQEAILKAFRGLPRFRKESKFSTWLVQIVINESKMKLRKDRRRLYDSLDEGIQNEDGDYTPRDFADWREIPSEALENQELRQALGHCSSHPSGKIPLSPGAERRSTTQHPGDCRLVGTLRGQCENPP